MLPGNVGLLIALCKADLHGELPPETAFPKTIPGWAALLDCAREHGIVGLLSRATAGLSHLPAEARQLIQAAALKETARSCYLTQELVEIVRCFEGAQIQVLAFKGPTLTVQAYGQLSSREFDDLDVLVSWSDAEHALSLLEERGYRTDPPGFTLADYVHEDANHTIMVRDDCSRVEVHWRLSQPRALTDIESTGIWSRARRIMVWDQAVLTMEPEDTLIFLSIHSFKHHWYRLKWLMDIGYLIQSQESLDWDGMARRARQIGCYRMLLTGLRLASQLLAVKIPKDIERDAGQPAVRKLEDQITGSLFTASPFDDVQELLYELEARERVRDRLVLTGRLIRRIFRLTDEDMPDDESPGTRIKAMVRRPVRLFRTFGLSWIKPIFRIR